jgi:hypothetical protein
MSMSNTEKTVKDGQRYCYACVGCRRPEPVGLAIRTIRHVV